MMYLTYYDVVENLIVSSFGGAQDSEQRDIRSSVIRAYNEVTTIRDWQWLHTHGRLLTSAPYSTGTISTSGTAVTLTGGTFPSWAATGGYLQVGEEIARVATRSSDTALVLDSTLTLKANVTDSVYTLYRTVYALPSDFRNMDEPSDEYNWFSGSYLTQDQAMKMERISTLSGSPLHWSVIKDPDSNGWAIRVYGYPTTVQTIDFTYRRTPRVLRLSGHEANSRVGTIERTGSAVTGTTTAFTAAMVGSILRVGDTSAVPGPQESLNPWVSESLITAYSSATAITAPSGTIAGSTKYLITDPIDVAPHMQQAVRSGAEYWLARTRASDKVERAFSVYQRDLRLAFEQEQLAPHSGRSTVVYDDMGWHSPLQADRGT